LVRRSLLVVSTTARRSTVRPSVRSEDRPAASTGFVSLSGFGRGRPPRSCMDRVAPPGVSRPFSDVSGGIVSPGPPGPEPSVLGVSHPLDGLISLAPCGLAGSAAAHGVLVRKALSDGKAVTARRIAAPRRPLRPFILGALQPRTLRNARSKAPRTPRRLSPFALVPRPWFQSLRTPFGAHHSRAVAEAFAPACPLARLSPRRLGEP
jgi:hypothetical protein